MQNEKFCSWSVAWIMRGEHVGAATAFTKPKINFRELLPPEKMRRSFRDKFGKEAVLEGKGKYDNFLIVNLEPC